MVEIQDAAETLSAQNTAAHAGVAVCWRNELVAERLMIALGVIVSGELPDEIAQVALAQRYDAA